MSIEKRYCNGNLCYDLFCDNCGGSETGFTSFDEAKDWAKENDWKSRKHREEWENWCPECLSLLETHK